MMKIPLGNDIDIDDSQFYNRVNDISFLYTYLKTTEDGSTPTILLTGLRGVGKTVLMKKLLRQFGNEYLGIYVNLEDCDPYNDGHINRLSFMKVFYDSIIRACDEFGLNTLNIKSKKIFKTHNLKLNNIANFHDFPVPIFHTEEDYSKFAKFVTDLPEKILDENNDILKGVWIFFDEFQHIKELDTSVISFLRYIRSLVQSQKSIGYVFSGSMSIKDELVDEISGKRGAFGGRILPFELQPFSYETTRSFLIEKADDLKFTEDGYEQFYKCTGGIPYYINSFAIMLKSNVVLDKEEVMLEFDRYLYYLADSSRKEWYKLTRQEMKIIASLVDKPLRRVDIARKLGVKSGALGRSLNSLVDHVLIELDGNQYHIIDKIFQAWLKSEYDKRGVFPFR